MLGDFGMVMFVEEQHVNNDQSRADGDGGIGDIERGPMVVAKPNLEEVGDGTVNDAVGYITGGTAKEKGKARGRERSAAMPRDEEPGQRADHYSGTNDQENAHSRGRGIGEDTKGDAWILAVHEVNEVVDDLPVPAFVRLLEPSFAATVQKNYAEGEPEPT